MRRRLTTAFLCITTTFFAVLPLYAQEAASPKITSPQDGDNLFGLITIQGTANNGNMQRYTLEFDSQDTAGDNFFPIAAPITQPVTAGILGQWNTTTVPDGRYQIRLSVILRDGTVLTTVVQNLHVTNKQPTPLPTSISGSQPIQSPTPGPSGTPLVQQPPTSTPQPAAVAPVATSVPPGANTSSQNSAPNVAVFSALQNAFCTGVYLAIGAFVLFGLYSLVHSRLRPTIQRMMNRR